MWRRSHLYTKSHYTPREKIGFPMTLSRIYPMCIAIAPVRYEVLNGEHSRPFPVFECKCMMSKLIPDQCTEYSL
jgi:hypothetical protein